MLAMAKRFVALLLGHDGLAFVPLRDLAAAAADQQIGVGESEDRDNKSCKEGYQNSEAKEVCDCESRKGRSSHDFLACSSARAWPKWKRS